MNVEATEAGVVIIGVIPLTRRRTTGDDAARAAIARTRGFHRVFVIPATRLARQVTFKIAEYTAILVVWERPAALNQRDAAQGFGRQKIR